MKVSEIAEGAYFVPSYSVQTLTTNYSQITAQQVLHAAQEEDESDNNKEIVGLEDN